jgi:pyruvate/2-oxoglutarate dehydrogenase complex dihydrolipoamide dehydrogenase (E3) component
MTKETYASAKRDVYLGHDKRTQWQVTVVAPAILPRESPRVQQVMADILVNSTGVRWVQGRAKEALRRMPGEVTLLLEGGGHVVGSRLLLACGRAVGANELALTKAGVLHDKEGIFVDKCQVLLHLNPISTRSQP